MIDADKGEIIYTTETVYNKADLSIRQITRLNGKLQSPPDDSPAQVLFDDKGRVREMVWWHKGQEHRDTQKGPAVIKIDPDSGIHVLVQYLRACSKSS